MTRISTRPILGILALAAVAGTALLLIAACGNGGQKLVTGLVLEAVERNISEIELLRLRDDDGRVWEFSTEGPVGTSAAHLRQHQVSGQKVTVAYVERGGRFVAVNVVDASPPGG